MTATTTHSEPLVRVGVERGTDGRPYAFTLTLGKDTITLGPCKSWAQADQLKWAARGLIEEPQVFQVLADGTVDVSGTEFRLADPQSVASLETELNKRHPGPADPTTGHSSTQSKPTTPTLSPEAAQRVIFKAKIDRGGHVQIECFRRGERTETGLRGLQALAGSGLLLSPRYLHVDPLQRWIEIDDLRIECNERGVRLLEETLNNRYAPILGPEQEDGVEVIDNLAASTGFDLRFKMLRGGSRTEVKGHLSQEVLDLLQDTQHCDLLQRDILLRLAPPHLVVRRRQPSGGEAPIPGIADIEYRRTTSTALSRVLNHPSIRRSSGSPTLAADSTSKGNEFVEIRVIRHADDKIRLWLEALPPGGAASSVRAFTHHNIGDLQHSGVFLPHLEVGLSLDHRLLGILDQQTGNEERLSLDMASSDEDLARASRMLTAALKPPLSPATKVQTEEIVISEPDPIRLESKLTPSEPIESAPAAPVEPIPIVAADAIQTTEQTTETAESIEASLEESATTAVDPALETTDVQGIAASETLPLPVEEPPVDPAIAEIFSETDPLRVNAEVFRCLAEHLALPVEDICFSLERVFGGRRFQILHFDEQQLVQSVFDLRGADFYGAYLSYIGEGRVDLVYACHGTHIEWATDKSLLQPAVTAEVTEFPRHALRGLAQNNDSQFVFIVEPEYKAWVRPHTGICAEALAHFITVSDFAQHLEDYVLLWPQPVGEACDLEVVEAVPRP